MDVLWSIFVSANIFYKVIATQGSKIFKFIYGPALFSLALVTTEGSKDRAIQVWPCLLLL